MHASHASLRAAGRFAAAVVRPGASVTRSGDAPSALPLAFDRVRSLTRAQARLESVVAQWLGARSRGDRLAQLAGGPVRAEVVAPSAAFDRFAARCELRVGGTSLDVRGASLGLRRIAQRVLGGPAELAAPRPLGVVEKSLWSLVVATALEDLGIAGEVWPQLDDAPEPSALQHAAPDDIATRAERPAASARAPRSSTPPSSTSSSVVELAVTLGDIALAVQLRVPADLVLRVPPSRTPAWFDTACLEVPIVLGRCALSRADLARLAVRDLVTLERPVGAETAAVATAAAELALAGGGVGLRASQGALEAEVATGYVPRDMSLPDDAHVELTVALGTTRLTLRQLGDLAIGQIVELGRPLAGPFELRAAGRVVGRGELVDVDGELAVRIVSLGD